MQRSTPPTHNRALVAAGLLIGLFCTAGCTSETVVVEERTGLLTLDWSIHGTFDPGLCDFYDVDAMEVLVYDEFGRFVAEVEAPCEAFTLTIELLDGFYDADATLVGFPDESATLTERIDGIDILPGTDIVIDVDFPPGTFF